MTNNQLILYMYLFKLSKQTKKISRFAVIITNKGTWKGPIRKMPVGKLLFRALKTENTYDMIKMLMFKCKKRENARKDREWLRL